MSSHGKVEGFAPAAEDLFDTSPPDEPLRASALRRWKSRATATVSAAILPIVKRVARPYVGGDSVGEALCVAERLAGEGFGTTLGYWDSGRESLRDIMGTYREAIARLGCGYVSLKPPALRFSAQLAGELAEAAAVRGMRLHCDSHAIKVADASNAMLEAMERRIAAKRLGTTLPGRWRRSLRDADWAAEHGLNVRVVKGQWPDPADPGRPMSQGFLEVIGRLAGRARHVAVATHDFALARESIDRLRSAGTSCEVEVLLGMPARPLVRWAKQNGVAVRVYVPYGAGFIPNALGVLKRNPRLAFAVAREYAALAGEFVSGLTKH